MAAKVLLLLAEGKSQYVTRGFDVWAAGRAGAEMPQEPGSRLYPEAESWAGAEGGNAASLQMALHPRETRRLLTPWW